MLIRAIFKNIISSVFKKKIKIKNKNHSNPQFEILIKSTYDKKKKKKYNTIEHVIVKNNVPSLKKYSKLFLRKKTKKQSFNKGLGVSSILTKSLPLR